MGKKKLFDFSIGNPPYNDDFEKSGDNGNFGKPVYNTFMDASYSVADRVELIHPARFLFDAGSTPKAWNRKMLDDPHFKVLKYAEDATTVFPNTDIKGGVAVTYHDDTKNFGPIEVFTKFDELNSILHKVTHEPSFKGMDGIVVTRTAYRLTEKMHQDHPEARYREDADGHKSGLLSKGHDYDMSTNIFSRLSSIFFTTKPEDGHEYIRICGRDGNDRVYRWVRKDYVNTPKPLYAYSIILPKANNTGRFGEPLSGPIITEPGTGSTETFLSVGSFATREEAENCLKYISTKFARAMLDILKTTQDLTPEKWKYVPIQQFTGQSDIQWDAPIFKLDQQLYQKYKLSTQEINFIETHVREMP